MTVHVRGRLAGLNGDPRTRMEKAGTRPLSEYSKSVAINRPISTHTRHILLDVRSSENGTLIKST